MQYRQAGCVFYAACLACDRLGNHGLCLSRAGLMARLDHCSQVCSLFLERITKPSLELTFEFFPTLHPPHGQLTKKKVQRKRVFKKRTCFLYEKRIQLYERHVFTMKNASFIKVNAFFSTENAFVFKHALQAFQRDFARLFFVGTTGLPKPAL